MNHFEVKLRKTGKRGPSHAAHMNMDWLSEMAEPPLVSNITEQQKRGIVAAIKECTTARQYEFIIEYYVYGKTIPEIAAERGLSKSSVSRTLKRGIDNCRKLIIL